MTTKIHDLGLASTYLNSNLKIAFSLNQVWYSLVNLPTYLQQKTWPKDLLSLPIFMLNRFEDLKNLATFLPAYLPLLVASLTPGPITLILKSNLESKPYIAVTFPFESELQSLISTSNNLLVAEPIVENLNLPLNTKLELPEWNLDKQSINYILDIQNSLNLQVENTVLDCTRVDEIQILKPGVVNRLDLEKLFGNSVKITEIYKQIPDSSLIITKVLSQSPELPISVNFSANVTLQLPIYRMANLQPKNLEQSLILGTKEKLREVFNLGFLDYFHIKAINSNLLINLGSQSNPEGIAKNLLENLSKLGTQTGYSKAIILWQNWGHSNWSEITEYYLKLVSKENLDLEAILNEQTSNLDRPYVFLPS